MSTLLIKNGTIVNEGIIFKADLLIENEIIIKIGDEINTTAGKVIDASGLHMFPRVIDDQIHYREPGHTHKGNIATESNATIAGGLSPFIEQPKTVPNAVTQEILEEKDQI